MSQTKAQLVSGTTAQDLTVDNINTTSINSGQTSGRKNLIINGAMQVAQRGTSYTGTAAYGTVDRMFAYFLGTDENPTSEQVDVASGTDPYTDGFRKAFKVTNGNNTGGAGTGDRYQMQYKMEAQDIANSGWNYLSSSSYITIQFWVKSSVAQTFYGYLRTKDGTSRIYTYSTGALSANTWTKITKTIPGSSLLQFDNDVNEGLQWNWFLPFLGTDLTDNSISLDSWRTYAGGTRCPDMTSTWYTTNDATVEFTGMQMEVGSTATDFEHKSFAEDLALCQRYFQFIGKEGTNAGVAAGFTTTTNFYGYGCLPGGRMRAAPTIAVSGTLSHLSYTHTAVSSTANNLQNLGSARDTYVIQITGNSSTTSNAGAYARIENASSALTFSSEL